MRRHVPQPEDDGYDNTHPCCLVWVGLDPCQPGAACTMVCALRHLREALTRLAYSIAEPFLTLFSRHPWALWAVAFAWAATFALATWRSA